MKFPKHIRINVKNYSGNNQPIHLTREDQKQELPGLSPKICYKDAETGKYILLNRKNHEK